MCLNHENVIKLLEIIFENAETGSVGTYGVVYEYLEGGNLHDCPRYVLSRLEQQVIAAFGRRFGNEVSTQSNASDNPWRSQS